MNILEKLSPILLGVKKPARYTGGEFGSITKNNENDYKIAVAFPDLYEIAMSNQALYLIYTYLNNMPNITAERVFTVASDFEKVLRDEKIPLYSLETFTPIKNFNMIAFTIGFELSFTNVLAMLDLSGLALKSVERADSDPLVIAGGVGVINPTIWGEFFDAIYIGEFEASFDTFKELANLKNASKQEQLNHLLKHPSFWVKGKTATRSSYESFGKDIPPMPIVNNIEVAQDHGVVEIMRGCPNGCRFCLAGTYYKPFRCKNLETILTEVDDLINKRGCYEISLNSLSSADFPYIKDLLSILNKRYKNRHISFGLPSLRVNSFGLDLLDELSSVRKSGLTFAVETPFESGQFSLNKPIEEAKIFDILSEARKRGWSKAKFYFMVGLPLGYSAIEEATAIADYMINLYETSKFEFNVNVGIFIPKPHTPYERARQISEEEANMAYTTLKTKLAKYKKIKIGFHSSFFAKIEGLIARGDERVADMVIDAYKQGARFDAWEDLADVSIWRGILNKTDSNLLDSIYGAKDDNDVLPWDSVNFRLRKNYMKDENKLSCSHTITNSCKSYPCLPSNGGPDLPCGACNKDVHVQTGETLPELPDFVELPKTDYFQRIVFTFTKAGRSKYLGHLDLLNIFKKALIRTGLNLRYTNGFNPQPKIDFASPLSLGIESICEQASIEICGDAPSKEEFLSLMQNNLNEGILVVDCYIEEKISELRKSKSLMAEYAGAVYDVKCNNAKDLVEKIVAFIDENNEITKENFIISNVKEGSFTITINGSGGKLENVSKLLHAVLGFNVLTEPSKIELTRVQILKKKQIYQIKNKI